MFVTNETTSPDLGSPIVSVSTFNPQQLRPNEIDEQMERFSETSSIELIIQGGGYEHQQQPVRVPESHTMQFNHYPGSKSAGHVPVDIVKSFTPVLATNEEKTPQDGGEIYSDYIHNPYNLTLRVDNTEPLKDALPSASTVFQSSSYFSSDANDLIGPGSDIFNRP